MKDLEGVNIASKEQLVCFMTGAGGSGKSRVIKAICEYARAFCINLNVPFTRRTVAVTALTGAAAVSIAGETTHSACCLNANENTTRAKKEEWENCHLVFVDEVSFAGKDTIEKLHQKLCVLAGQPNKNRPFGGYNIVFSGDFSQLAPVGAMPVFLYDDFVPWREWVNTFLELRTSHRFNGDPEWGHILDRFRGTGPTSEDVEKINSRVIGSAGGPVGDDVPNDAIFAVRTNAERNAITDGIFLRHLAATHSKDPLQQPPMHTIVIRADKLRWKKSGSRREYVKFNKIAEDLLYAGCSDDNLCVQKSRRIDPLLKLYSGCPIMLNQNTDVERCEANGARCTFVKAKLNVPISMLEKVVIEGYYVWCASVSQVDSLLVRNEDAPTADNEEQPVFELKAATETCTVNFPVPLLSSEGITKKTFRMKQRMQIRQFPINLANATTVHKLQGRSLRYLVILGFDPRDNWIYVVLSRVRMLKGLFLCKPLLERQVKGMSADLLSFLDIFRQTKAPQAAVSDPYRREYN